MSKPRQVLKRKRVSHSFPVLALMKKSPSVVAVRGFDIGIGVQGQLAEES